MENRPRSHPWKNDSPRSKKNVFFLSVLLTKHTHTHMNPTTTVCRHDASFGFLGHVGFGLLACSYALTDPVRLRLCVTLSNAVLLTWGVLALPEAACWTTIGWNSLFCVVNLICVARYDRCRRYHSSSTNPESDRASSEEPRPTAC